MGFTSGQLVRIGFFWFLSVFFGFIDNFTMPKTVQRSPSVLLVITYAILNSERVFNVRPPLGTHVVVCAPLLLLLLLL